MAGLLQGGLRCQLSRTFACWLPGGWQNLIEFSCLVLHVLWGSLIQEVFGRVDRHLLAGVRRLWQCRAGGCLSLCPGGVQSPWSRVPRCCPRLRSDPAHDGLYHRSHFGLSHQSGRKFWALGWWPFARFPSGALHRGPGAWGNHRGGPSLRHCQWA